MLCDIVSNNTLMFLKGLGTGTEATTLVYYKTHICRLERIPVV